MKRLLFVLLTVSVAACAQTPAGAPTAQTTQRDLPITKSDVYCAGFMSKPLPRTRFVAGGLNSPTTSRFATRDFVYLRGSGYKPGERVSIVREMRDPAVFSASRHDRNLRAGLGEVYGDIGYATVVENRGTDIAVAQVEFTCAAIVAGDLAVPFTERAIPEQRKTSTYDRFATGAGEVNGRIVAARDFDQFLAAGRKVYLNVGASKGIKAGDYLQVVRGYQRNEMDLTDEVSLDATYMEDTQKNPPRLPNSKLKDLPRHVVGEVVILSTQPGTATAMIVNSLEEIHVGDSVEMRQ